MKNKQLKESRFKKTLQKKKQDGVKSVIWRLDNIDRIEEVTRLGYRFEPWLYEVPTRTFKQISGKPALLKELHYSYKAGKRRIVRRLTKGDLILLKEYNLKPRVLKYKIYLV